MKKATMNIEIKIKERPILFSDPMVLAILKGRKTQMRRIVKPQPIIGVSLPEKSLRDTRPKRRGKYEFMGSGPGDDPAVEISLKPYAFPGDQLWVKEAWQAGMTESGPAILYRADGQQFHPNWGGQEFPFDRYPTKKWSKGLWLSDVGSSGPWASSIHMPRWASRITLEVVGVRIERLQEISEADAIAEGAERDVEPCDHHRRGCEEIGCLGPTHKSNFRALWQAIHGHGSWQANPWVWVMEFERIYQ